jgi:hypothetical protein
MAKVKTQARVTVQFRMLPAERKTFTAAAQKVGLSLSAWLRMIAHNEVARGAKQ